MLGIWRFDGFAASLTRDLAREEITQKGIDFLGAFPGGR